MIPAQACPEPQPCSTCVTRPLNFSKVDSVVVDIVWAFLWHYRYKKTELLESNWLHCHCKCSGTFTCVFCSRPAYIKHAALSEPIKRGYTVLIFQTVVWLLCWCITLSAIADPTCACMQDVLDSPMCCSTCSWPAEGDVFFSLCPTPLYLPLNVKWRDGAQVFTDLYRSSFVIIKKNNNNNYYFYSERSQ